MVEINKHFYCSLHTDVAKKKGGGDRERHGLARRKGLVGKWEMEATIEDW